MADNDMQSRVSLIYMAVRTMALFVVRNQQSLAQSEELAEYKALLCVFIAVEISLQFLGQSLCIQSQTPSPLHIFTFHSVSLQEPSTLHIQCLPPLCKSRG